MVRRHLFALRALSCILGSSRIFWRAAETGPRGSPPWLVGSVILLFSQGLQPILGLFRIFSFAGAGAASPSCSRKSFFISSWFRSFVHGLNRICPFPYFQSSPREAPILAPTNAG